MTKAYAVVNSVEDDLPPSVLADIEKLWEDYNMDNESFFRWINAIHSEHYPELAAHIQSNLHPTLIYHWW